MFSARGIGLLPRLPHDPDPTLFAPYTEPKLSRSLSLPFVPLPSGASCAIVFRCTGVDVPTIVGPLRTLVGIVNVGRGPSSSLGACLIGMVVALMV
jgi:hypothetical protein